MNKVARGFDRLAPFYDALSTLVFGSAIKRAQRAFLPAIADDARVLILGGGTGWILREVCGGLRRGETWYVDISPEMVKRARNAVASLQNVHFVQGTLADVGGQQFDVIIVHFYLDLFTPKQLGTQLAALTRCMNADGVLLVCDFNDYKRWHKFMLWVMYRFFRIFCHIESTFLPRWREALEAVGWREVAHHCFHGGFISSAMYKCPSPAILRAAGNLTAEPVE